MVSKISDFSLAKQEIILHDQNISSLFIIYVH